MFQTKHSTSSMLWNVSAFLRDSEVPGFLTVFCRINLHFFPSRAMDLHINWHILIFSASLCAGRIHSAEKVTYAIIKKSTYLSITCLFSLPSAITLPCPALFNVNRILHAYRLSSVAHSVLDFPKEITTGRI